MIIQYNIINILSLYLKSSLCRFIMRCNMFLLSGAHQGEHYCRWHVILFLYIYETYWLPMTVFIGFCYLFFGQKFIRFETNNNKDIPKIKQKHKKFIKHRKWTIEPWGFVMWSQTGTYCLFKRKNTQKIADEWQKSQLVVQKLCKLLAGGTCKLCISKL